MGSTAKTPLDCVGWLKPRPGSSPAAMPASSASHANAMARRLRDALDAGIAAGDLPGLAFTQQTQSNGVFATLPAGVADRLRDRGFRFYDWDASRNEVRWMCSFDTSEADIDAFVAGIREELARV